MHSVETWKVVCSVLLVAAAIASLFERTRKIGTFTAVPLALLIAFA